MYVLGTGSGQRSELRDGFGFPCDGERQAPCVTVLEPVTSHMQVQDWIRFQEGPSCNLDQFQIVWLLVGSMEKHALPMSYDHKIRFTYKILSWNRLGSCVALTNPAIPQIHKRRSVAGRQPQRLWLWCCPREQS